MSNGPISEALMSQRLTLEDFIRHQRTGYREILEQEDKEAQQQAQDHLKNPGPGAISDDEREWLRRLINEPGWTVLIRLIENIIREREENAKLISETDPLNNRDKIANAWTYSSAIKEVKRALLTYIGSEIQKIGQEKVLDGE